MSALHLACIGFLSWLYKAAMPVGGVVAVKVLASNSRQGEKEFQTECNYAVFFSSCYELSKVPDSLFILHQIFEHHANKNYWLSLHYRKIILSGEHLER